MSSSGRDEFDSDFDLTDSYPGKRGRKKKPQKEKKLKKKRVKTVLNNNTSRKLQKDTRCRTYETRNKNKNTRGRKTTKK